MTTEANLKENFARNLARLRKAMGLTQEELVNELQQATDFSTDITRSALASYENQKSLPRLDVFHAICRYFDVTMDDMLEQEAATTRSIRSVSEEEIPVERMTQELSEMKALVDMYKAQNAEMMIRLRALTPEGEEQHKADFLRRMYNYPYWRDAFREVLDELEFEVFYAVQDGESKDVLAAKWNREPQEIVEIFHMARSKILDYFRKQ